MVKEIDGYDMRISPTTDPIQLVWMVNQVDGYEDRSSAIMPADAGDVFRQFPRVQIGVFRSMCRHVADQANRN